jgi:PAS domain S-box-containing protein
VKLEAHNPLSNEAADGAPTAEQRLKAALAASRLALWDWDLPAGTVFVDRMFFRFLGLPEQDRVVPVTELAKLVHAEDNESFSNAMQDLRLGRSAELQVCYRARHADGRLVWLQTCGSVTARDANGRPTRLTGTHADITEQRQVDRALSNTLRVMQALLETLPLPVVLRDAERRVTLVNAAWEKMIGLSREEAVGKLLGQGPRREPTQGHRETDDQVFETLKPLRYETVVHSIDGKPFNVIVAKTPLLAADGSLTGIASVVIDISDEKRAAAELERARAAAEAAVHAKSRFLANMSHELRTPLNGVVGMTSLLEQTTLDARQRRFVRTLRTSAEALITLINDVLDLSKAEAGKLELARAPFELRRELEQVVGLFSGPASDKGLEIAAHIGRDVPATIQGDPIRLRQVLGNLVNNAVKFTEKGAVLLSVTVAGERANELSLEFSVTDTGVGVAPEVQKRIFDAFEQADGSVTRRFGGTGLGLAISRQIVELMQGAMAVASAPGRGSRFSFTIPAGVPPLPARPFKPSNDAAAVIMGVHPVIRAAVSQILFDSCAQVLTVDSLPNGTEALRKLGVQVTQLRAVIDADDVPDVEHAIRALRAAAENREIEIIVLKPAHADNSLPAGATRVLVKPLLTPDLIQAAPAATPEPAQTIKSRAIPRSGSRGRALVVEDNAVNQEMARYMLDMLGFTVTTASNGHEGVLAAAADPNLAIILMDCQMPVMDGLAAARAIRDGEPTDRHVPIVALTGNALPGDREACVAAGMDDYLAKPFSLTALRTIIDKWTSDLSLSATARRRRLQQAL